MTDRGTKLEQAQESLERAERALARNLGTLTEPDWREMVERYRDRVRALEAVQS